MATVYILYSSEGDSYYIGSCSDLKLRYKEHLEGKYRDSYTKRYND